MSAWQSPHVNVIYFLNSFHPHWISLAEDWSRASVLTTRPLRDVDLVCPNQKSEQSRMGASESEVNKLAVLLDPKNAEN
jgi:hypothetical protein